MATTSEQDILWCYNPTTQPFTVKWGGHPYTVKSGEKKLFPRFIAEHFAKHLADAILMRKEEDERLKKGTYTPMINNRQVRPKIINVILPGVQTYFIENEQSQGDAVARMVDEVNRGADMSQAPATEDKELQAMDFGLVEDRAVGVLAEPDTPSLDEVEATPDQPANDGRLLDEVADNKPEAPTPTYKPVRTRQELMKEARQLGVEVKVTDTRDELEARIKQQFA